MSEKVYADGVSVKARTTDYGEMLNVGIHVEKFINVNAEVRDAEMAYNAARLALLNSSDKASHAKMRAEATPEYARYRLAKDTREQVKTMRGTLNTVLRSLSDEMRLA